MWLISVNLQLSSRDRKQSCMTWTVVLTVTVSDAWNSLWVSARRSSFLNYWHFIPSQPRLLNCCQKTQSSAAEPRLIRVTWKPTQPELKPVGRSLLKQIFRPNWKKVRSQRGTISQRKLKWYNIKYFSPLVSLCPVFVWHIHHRSMSGSMPFRAGSLHLRVHLKLHLSHVAKSRLYLFGIC